MNTFRNNALHVAGPKLQTALTTPAPDTHCPFCLARCAVGWDCECGAKAVNSELWIDTAKPLMRAACLGDMGLFLATMTNTTGQSLREMLNSDDL